MRAPQADGWTRRRFLGGLALAGTAGLLGLPPRRVGAEPPPETSTLRIFHTMSGGSTSICTAPQFMAEELLHGEGFTEVSYVKDVTRNLWQTLAAGEADLGVMSVFPLISGLDGGAPLVLLSGVHGGCYELYGTAQVRAIRDLKGKTVSVGGLGSGSHLFLASMLAYVGLNPQQDITWDVHPWAEAIQLLAEGKIDAVMGFAPDTSALHAQQIGHMVVNTGRDRPWSQYFCCLAAGNRAFVRTHPIATKRALRALLKATDLCALEPERVARFMVDKGYVERYANTVERYANTLERLKDLSYHQWREHDPEDTVRFYALRLHEVGMIKSTPQKLIAQGTDWRFLNELKKELKG
jgi:NitT/TauT family transport system substrate-binding protein